MKYAGNPVHDGAKLEAWSDQQKLCAPTPYRNLLSRGGRHSVVRGLNDAANTSGPIMRIVKVPATQVRREGAPDLPSAEIVMCDLDLQMPPIRSEPCFVIAIQAR